LLVVSYHRAHSVHVGAVAAIIGHGSVFDILLLESILIHVDGISVHCFQLIVVSIADILSYNAFFDGAIPVTPSQDALYAASDTAHCVAADTWSSTYFFVAASVLFVGAGITGLELNVFIHATVSFHVL